MSNNDKIINDLNLRKIEIDKRFGEGSTKKLIELSEDLSTLYKEKIFVLFSNDYTKEEKIMMLEDIEKRISDRIHQTRRSRRGC